jgi:aryl-alcohol dehydrogenase-like predicted oxidoreductase
MRPAPCSGFVHALQHVPSDQLRVVGRALTSLRRDQVVISTKSTVRHGGERVTPERLVASIDNSLRVMGTEHIDVFNLHGVLRDDYGYALETPAPVLDTEKRKGKIRHIGITEAAIVDHTNEMLKRALRDPVWEVFMVAFHMMHQVARSNVFAHAKAKGIGMLLMFAVGGIFADQPRISREVKELAAKGLVDPSLGATDDPLGFLIHEGGASNLVEAAYRYARHEPGVDVVLFGTGDVAHLRSNVVSLLRPDGLNARIRAPTFPAKISPGHGHGANRCPEAFQRRTRTHHRSELPCVVARAKHLGFESKGTITSRLPSI